MPVKNIVKVYKENSFYHIYNRGVAGQKIFRDAKDYKMFLFYLKFYLSSPDLQGPTLKVSPSRQLFNYFEQITLAAYCLMPNHYHILLFQKDKYLIRYFMKSMGTKYSLYFNKRYKRRGPLFEGNYKAVLIDSEEQLTYLSKYIHRNPVNILPSRSNLEGYKYSSYGNYLGNFSQNWIKPKLVLRDFKRKNKILNYKDFVEKIDEDLSPIKNYILD
ncbi:MAG: transposase [Candidatus Beckwithbacteria bacterium]|nr:transposase [Patescibacteria group bacterium]